MKRLLFILSILTAPLPALLPPVWQGIAEVKAIVSDLRLDNYLNSADILEGIYRTEGGWIIKTDKTEVKVKVLPKPQDKPGPEKFELQFFS